MLEGIIITLLVLTKFRQLIMDIVPMELEARHRCGHRPLHPIYRPDQRRPGGGQPRPCPDPTAPPVHWATSARPPCWWPSSAVCSPPGSRPAGCKAALLVGILGATVFAMCSITAALAFGNGGIYPASTGWAVIPYLALG